MEDRWLRRIFIHFGISASVGFVIFSILAILLVLFIEKPIAESGVFIVRIGGFGGLVGIILAIFSWDVS